MFIYIQTYIHTIVGVNKQLNLFMSYSLSSDRLKLLNKGKKQPTTQIIMEDIHRLDQTYNDNEIIAQ